MVRPRLIATWFVYSLLIVACRADPVAQPVSIPDPTTYSQSPPDHAAQEAHTGLAAPIPAASSSGFLLYSRADGSLWRADASGQAPRQLAPPTNDGSIPRWAASPDSSTIAIITSGYIAPARQHNGVSTTALWLIRADGTEARKVLDLLPAPQHGLALDLYGTAQIAPQIAQQTPVWSPDGRMVAVISANNGYADLYLVSHDGEATRVTNTPELEQAPLWSPNGGQLSFLIRSQLEPQATLRLGVAQRDGRLLVEGAPLTFSDQTAVTDLNGRAWIDGHTMVLGLQHGQLCANEVQLFDTATITSRSLYAQKRGCISAPQWGAGAGLLAFGVSGGESEDNGLYTWTPDAPYAQRYDPRPPLELAWNPAGDTLLYRQADAPDRVTLWRIGAGAQQLEVAAWPPHWSPDGRTLALGDRLLDRSGQPRTTLPGAHVMPLGWSAAGLYFTTLPDDEADALDVWLWDGQQRLPVLRLPDDSGPIDVVPGR